MTIVAVFCIGYFLIALESITRINKAAIALLMMAVTWTLFMIDPAGYLSVADGQAAAQASSRDTWAVLPPHSSSSWEP